MTKLLIVSDAHGNQSDLVAILKRYTDMDAIFYNGDSEMNAREPFFDNVYTVIGNMDSDTYFADHHFVKVNGLAIFQTHGHLYQATDPRQWADTSAMSQAADEVHAQVVLFGHTHKEGVYVIDNKLFINPGSITIPKGEHAYLGGTYAIMETANNHDFSIDFYQVNGQVVPELHQNLTL